MIEDVFLASKPPPAAGKEPGARAARAERDSTLSFEEVLERKKKAGRASREVDEASTVPFIAPPRQGPQPDEPEKPAGGQETVEAVGVQEQTGPLNTAQPASTDAAQSAGADAAASLDGSQGADGAAQAGPVLEDFSDALAASAGSTDAAALASGNAVDGAVAATQGAGETIPAEGEAAPAAPQLETPPAPGGESIAEAEAPAAAPEAVELEATPRSQESKDLPSAAAETIAARPPLEREPAPVRPRETETGVENTSARAQSAQAAAPRPEMAPSTSTVQEPARQAEASQELLNQVAQNIQLAASRNGATMRVHLNPHELGSIDIRLVSNQNGVGIMVLAEKAATSHLLESQMAQLQQAVLNTGVQVAQLWVGQNHSSNAQADLFAQGGGSSLSGEHGGGQPGDRLSGGSKGSGQPGPAKKSARYSVIDYRA